MKVLLFSLFVIFVYGLSNAQVNKNILITNEGLNATFIIHEDFVYSSAAPHIIKYDLNDLGAAPDTILQDYYAQITGMTIRGSFLYFTTFEGSNLTRVPISSSTGMGVEDLVVNGSISYPLEMIMHNNYIYVLETGVPVGDPVPAKISKIDVSTVPCQKTEVFTYPVGENLSDFLIADGDIYAISLGNIYKLSNIDISPSNQLFATANTGLQRTIAKVASHLFTSNTVTYPDTKIYKYSITGTPTQELYTDSGAICLFAYNNNLYGSNQGEIFVYESPTSTTSVDEQKITVFPNPTTDIIHFEIVPEEVYLYDINGKQISCSIQQSTINLSHLAAGTYLLTYKTKGSESFSTQLIYKQ